MKGLISGLDRMMKVVLVVLMLVLVLSIVWQVLSRYVLNSPSAVTEELARYVMIWMALLGASYVFRLRMHLGLNLFTHNLRGVKKQWVEFISLAAVVVFAVCVMIIGGGHLVLMTAELGQITAVLGIPVAYVYVVIPISGLFIVLYCADFAKDLMVSGAIAEGGSDTQGKNQGEDNE